MTSTASDNVAAPVKAARPAASLRDPTVDFVKGALVVLMVVYHAMNVFSTAGPEAYAPLRFVSGAFIFMAGFVIARFQLDAFGRDRPRTSWRLVGRGFKLLVLFTILNVAINLTGVGNPEKVQPGVVEFAASARAVYLVGDTGRASFQILLPIAYVMMASPALLALHRFKTALLAVSLAAVLCLEWSGIAAPNLDLALIGVVGLAFGMLARDWRPPVIANPAALLACLALAFILAPVVSTNALTYVLTIVVIVKLFSDAGTALHAYSPATEVLSVLGRYSLVAYIVHIILLQAFSRAMGRPKWELGLSTLVVTVITCVVLWAVIALLERLLQRSRFAARCYRLVFV